MSEETPRPLTELEQKLYDECTVANDHAVFKIDHQSFAIACSEGSADRYRRQLAVALARLIETRGLKSVFVVTSGSYSDFHIDEICSDEQVANTICGELGRDAGVEEWELNTAVPRFYRYVARMALNIPDSSAMWPIDDAHVEGNYPITDTAVFRLQAGLRTDQGHRAFVLRRMYILDTRSFSQPLFYVEGLGEDEEAAIKNAADYKAAVLADQPHPNDRWVYDAWRESLR